MKIKRNSPRETGNSENTAAQTAKNVDDGSVQGKLCGYPLASAAAAENAECEWQELKIRLEIPEGWEYAAEEYSDETGRFGVRFWPEGCSGRVGIYHYDFFGVCGTGLVEQDISFDSGLSGRMGIYDGGDTWSFIVFPEQSVAPEYFVALADEAGEWLTEYGDEVLEILGTAVLEAGNIN